MDYLKKKTRNVHPKTNTDFFSNIFFIYTLKVFRKGSSKPFVDDDLYEPPAGYDSNDLAKHLEKQWKKIAEKEKSVSFFLLIWKCYGWHYFLLGVIQFCVDLTVMLVQPYCLGKVISYFSPKRSTLSKHQVYLYIALIVGLQVFSSIYKRNNALLLRGLGIQARTAVSSFIYAKLLKLQNFNFKNDLGRVLTLITKDVYALETFTEVGNDTWILFLKTVVVTTLFYFKVDKKIMLGSLLFWIYIPLQIYGITKIIENKRKLCTQADYRFQLIKETVSHVRPTKMYTWETIFESKVSKARQKEVSATQKIFLVKHIFAIISNALTTAAMIVIFTLYKNKSNVSAATIYYIFATFRTLNMDFGTRFTKTSYRISEFYISAKRLELFMNLTEPKRDSKITNYLTPTITVQNLSFTQNNKTIFKNINCTLEKGVTIVTGPINSGKSTLFQIILQELKATEGKINVNGELSFASQQPWLFPSTIRQNIVFGEKYDKAKYKHILELCCLSHDIDILDAGDLTIVEDCGHNLSWGQQKRINLARAIYKNSDIFLLDNCLDGLDNQVKNQIFNKCFKEHLRNKIVLLITQDNLCLEKADQILNLDSKCIMSLQQNNVVIPNKLNAFSSVSNEIISDSTLEEDDEETKLLKNNEEKEIYHERHCEGSISLKTYQKFLKHGRYTTAIVTLTCFALLQFFTSYKNILVSKWANYAEQSFRLSISNISNLSTIETIGEKTNRAFLLFNIASAVGIGCFLFSVVGLYLFFKKLQNVLHKNLFTTILHAPLAFFDTHFIGNILNRFSKDFVVVDDVLQDIILAFLLSSLSAIGSVILIAKINYIFLAPMIILVALEYFASKYFLRTSRNLERLEASKRSPVVGYVNTSVEGLSTIRSARVEQTLIREFFQHQNCYTSASYTFHSCKHAFMLFIHILTSISLAVVFIICLIFKENIMGGSVGLVVTEVVMLDFTLQVTVMLWTNIENQMTAVERILEYSRTDKENSSGRSIDNFPNCGKISIKNLYLQYPNRNQFSLKNINLEIKPQDKIAIVGRTGAGKTSLSSTLFRLYDYKGDITIDDVNIKSLPLSFLRSQISVIPQEVLIFSGSIRDNIDPFKKLSDEEIWKVIKFVKLDAIVSNLDATIIKTENSFSAGLQKLICLARALTNPSKILVLDEPAANLDEATNVLIENIIQSEFKTSTVILITHKISPNLKFNKIVAINDGEIIDYVS